MGFYKDNIGTIWAIEDHGEYSVAQISCARKDKSTGALTQEFNGFVTLSKTAHEKGKTLDVPNKFITSSDARSGETKGVVIRFGNGNVTTKYVEAKKKTYTNYTLFSFHTVEWDKDAGRWVNNDGDDDESVVAPTAKKPSTRSKAKVVEDDADDLPF